MLELYQKLLQNENIIKSKYDENALIYKKDVGLRFEFKGYYCYIDILYNWQCVAIAYNNTIYIKKNLDNKVKEIIKELFKDFKIKEVKERTLLKLEIELYNEYEYYQELREKEEEVEENILEIEIN